MANLVIDIGNSFIKTGVFDNDELLYTNHYKAIDESVINRLLIKYNINRTIIATVKASKEEWCLMLEQKTNLIYFSRQMAPGIKNNYRSPETLGLDRLAAVAGAKCLFPGVDSLVIDGGTCITYDWVDKDGNYYGGSISPGLNMRYKALNAFTAALPLIDTDDSFNENYGDNTTDSIISGVQNGLKYEITGFISSYTMTDNALNIVLTGGDGIFFDRLLKNSIFAPYIKMEPSLVLRGLNAAIQQTND